jgi:outer membrane protein OmpA-like peptidoglycan-associated protein
MMRRILLAATGLAFSLPVAAWSQTSSGPITGLYVGAGVGWNYLQSEQLKNFATQSAAFGGVSVNNKSVNFGSGLATVLSLGWGFGNGLRAEIEGNYRYNSNNANGSSPIFSSVQGTKNGTENKAGVMVNVLYDFTDAFGPGYTPYIGAGVGWQYIRESNLQIFGLLPAGPSAGQPYGFRVNNGTNTFAYQAIVGMAFSLASWVPGLDATLEYRFLGTGGDRTYKAQFFAPQVARGTNFQVGSEYNHAIMVGLRYAFNTAPPPPPPAVVTPPPAREAARTYLVFFDWDRADLTPRARQVVSEAAQATTHVQVTRIQVNGYTDTSGTPRYNQGLSVRRGQSVANELVRDGVPRQAISIQGFGETHLLVPTADGVREPQNRRVEIILQ